MIVVDATAAIAWTMHEDDKTVVLGEELADEQIVAPALWRLEVLNVVLKKERQRILTVEQGCRMLRDLDALGVQIVDVLAERTFEQLAELARKHQLSAYDAIYLDLAIAANASLWTLDQNLIDAAGRIGVPLFTN
jgi:predicted nucleic acid-binding protein